MGKNKSAKRIPKNKEQLAAMAEHHNEIVEQKKLAETHLVPVLAKYDLTVYKSGEAMEVLRSVIFASQNKHWEDKKIKDLGLREQLASEEGAKDKDLYDDLLSGIENEPISKILKLLEVMGRVIDLHSSRKAQQIKFTELPIDELMK